MVNFRIASEPSDMLSQTRDPSGFSDSGFQQAQAAQVQTFVTDAFRQFQKKSQMPPGVESALPQEIPLYCSPSPISQLSIASNLMSADFSEKILLPNETIAFRRRETHGLCLNLTSAFLKSQWEQQRIAEALRYCFCAQIVNLFCNPFNFSRDAAMVGGVLNKLEGKTEMDPRTSQGTTGLSTPDGSGLDISGGDKRRGVNTMSKSALNDLPLDLVWRVYVEMIQKSQNVNRALTNGETDGIFQSNTPQHATAILHHPAFLPVAEGPHVIWELNRDRTEAVIWPLLVTKTDEADDLLLKFLVWDRNLSELKLRAEAFSANDKRIKQFERGIQTLQVIDLAWIADQLSKHSTVKLDHCFLHIENRPPIRLEVQKKQC